jgi:hypothetical protein
MTDNTDGQLQVWWIPQVPMEPFLVNVDSVQEAALICTALANYDIFQFENGIKPDYSNAGGLRVFRDGDWEDWLDEDGCTDFDEYQRIWQDEKT